MQKNVASQKIGCQMVSATDGSAFTGSVTVAVTIDAGTQATGSVGSGACTHEGNGYHTYAPAQAETNGTLIAFTFTGTGAVPATVQVFTTGFDITAAQVPANATQLAGQTVTAAAGVTFPSSVASPTNITAGTITTVTNLTNAPTAGDLTATMKTSVGTAVAASAVASVTGNVGGNVTGSVASVASGGITAASFAADAITAAKLAADVTTELQAGLATAANLATVAGYIDTEVAAIKAVTDKIDTAVELDGAVYRFTTNALEQAPTGGGAADGSGFTAIPWNAAWDAEVQSECADALTAYDPPTKAELDSAVAPLATATALTAVDDLIDTEVAAIKTVVDAILVDTAEIGAAGAGLTALASQTSVNTIDDFLDTEVAAIKAKTDQLAFTTANQVDARVLTNSDKTGYALASGGIGSGAHAAAELNAIADAVLDRNMATGTDSGTDSTSVRTVRQALRRLRNKEAIAAGTGTVYKENDTTASWTYGATTTASDPLSAVDPT